MHIRKFPLSICPSIFSSTACGTIVKSVIIATNIMTSSDTSRIANLCRISICRLMSSNPEETRHP